MPQAQPELKKVRLPAHLRQYPDTNRGHGTQYMEKRLFVQLNGNRKVIGVLRGYDVRDIPSWLFSIHTQRARARTLRVTGRHGWLTIRAQVFMNIVLDEAVEEKANGEKEKLGMVVCSPHRSLFGGLVQG